MGEWQPIETAPKDGTFILAFGRAYPELVEGSGRWITAKPEVKRVPFCMIVRWIEGWYEKEIEISPGSYRKEPTQGYAYWAPEPQAFTPTHWQRLPDCPSSATSP
jgi:hypothetical protein